MKKLIIAILTIVLMLGTATAEKYPRFGNVVDLEYDSDFVTVDDGLGNLWDFYGVDFYFYGDLVLLIMDDNGTPDYDYDDRVEDAQKVTYDEALEIIENWKQEKKLKFLNTIFQKTYLHTRKSMI